MLCKHRSQVTSPVSLLQGRLGIAAEHGFYIRRPGEEVWDALKEDAGTGWRDMVQPIMKLYADSTDGSYTEEKESALVWNYSQADPDFGHWQVCVCQAHIGYQTPTMKSTDKNQ